MFARRYLKEIAGRSLEWICEPRAVEPTAYLGPSALETGITMTAEATLGRVRPASDYADLMAEVQRENLLDRRGLNYLARMISVGVMFALGIGAFVWLGESWWQMGVAAYFAIVFAQVGFLGHDAGHQQIFSSKRRNDRTGLLLSNFAVGLSYSWWVDKHNRHHRNPNEVGRDPDVARNVLAWTSEQAMEQRGPLRFIARHQAALFFPLLTLEAWNLHVGSIRVLIKKPKGQRLEIALLAAHVAGTVGVLLWVLSPVKAIAFVAVQQSLFGIYLGSSFAPNHKGMRVLHAGSTLDFLRRQVLTSRNVAGGRLTSYVLGSLNYQIEHHLFPSMPSRNLRRCQPIVKAFCQQRGVSYCETSLAQSYGQVLAYLHAVRPRATSVGQA